MRRMAAIALAVITLCLTAQLNTTSADDQTVSVVSDGYSYLGDNDTIKTARERAMAEAERNAVEQGSYSYLESQTTVKNFQVTTDEIRSQVKGVITSKKILVDELEKDSFRYHVQIEAEVKFADLKTILEQHELTDFSAQDQPPPAISSAAPNNAPPHPPSREDHLAVRNQLRRLKNENPYNYIRLMMHFQPKLDDEEVFVKRLRRVQARDPGAGQHIRNSLHRTPIRERGKSELRQRIRFLKRRRPRDYIFVMEILYPEVRPLAMEKRWQRMGEEEREAIATFVTSDAVH